MSITLKQACIPTVHIFSATFNLLHVAGDLLRRAAFTGFVENIGLYELAATHRHDAGGVIMAWSVRLIPDAMLAKRRVNEESCNYMVS